MKINENLATMPAPAAISCPSGESPPSPCRIQVDAAEDQRQVGGLDLQATLIRSVGRELEGPSLQPLLPDRVAVAIPVQDLQAVPRLPPKDERWRMSSCGVR